MTGVLRRNCNLLKAHSYTCAEKQISWYRWPVRQFHQFRKIEDNMMNRDSFGRNRSSMSSRTTTFGIDERIERTLLYPISALAGLFWPLGWVVGLIVVLFEKNHNVRMHALQSSMIFGVLSILLALVGFLHGLLGGFPLLGGLLIGPVLGFIGLLLFWLIVLLAVWLTIMVWFFRDYRLPFVGRKIENLLSRWG